MSSDYLKQLQLTKQLEQKAKEATRDRKAAEDVLAKTGEALAKARIPDVDLSEAERALEEGNAAFAKRNYPASVAAARRCQELIPQAWRAAVAAMLSSSEAVLALVPGDGLGPEVQASIAAARGLMEKGSADEALAAARSSREQAEEYLGTRLSALIADLHALVAQAEAHGIPVAERRKALEEVEALHRQGDRTAALDLLRAQRDGLLNAFTAAFDERSAKIAAAVEGAAITGADLSPLSSRLAAARADLDGGSPEKALAGLGAAEKDLAAALKAAVEAGLAAHRERASWLEEKGIRPEEALAADAKAAEAVRAGSEAGSLEWLRRSDRALREGEAAIVLAEMGKLRPGLNLARRIGNDLSGPLAKLEEAKRAMQGSQAPRALDLVEEVASRLDLVLKGHRDLEEEVRRTAGMFRRARTYRVDLKDAGKAAAESRAAARRGDLEGAIRRLKEAQHLLLRSVRRHCAAGVLGTEVDVAFAAGMGADVEAEAAELDDLVRTLREDSSDEALIRLSRLERSVRAKGRARSAASVEEAEGPAPENGPALPQDRPGEARLLLGSGDWKGAHLAAADVLNAAAQRQRQARTELSARARKLLDIGRQLGCGTAGLERQMAAAGGSADAAEALSILGELVPHIESIVKDELVRSLGALTEEIGGRRENGVPVPGAESCAREAAEALERNDLDRCFSRSKDGKRELRKVVALHREAGDLIAFIAAHVDSARPATGKYGVPALLKEARDLYEAGKYDGARVSARKCFRELERTGAAVLAPEKLREAEALAEDLRELVRGPPEAEEDIRRAAGHLARGDSAAALAAAEKAHRKAAERLAAEIERTRDMLSGERGRRLPLPPSGGISEAEDLLAAKRYADAARVLRSARSELDRTFRIERDARVELEEAGEELNEIEGAGVGVPDERKDLARARAALERGERDGALEQARGALEAARKAARAALVARIGEAEAEAGAERLKGRDLGLAPEEVRRSVQERLDRRRFPEAGELTGRYAAVLRRLRSQRDRCAAALEEDVPPGWPLPDAAEELRAQARAAFGEGAFEEAWSLLAERAAVRRAAQALHDRSAARLADARRAIEEEGRKFPDEQVAELLRKAEEALARGRYADMELAAAQAAAALAAARERSCRRDAAEMVRLTQALRALGTDLLSLPERTRALLDMRMSELREGSVHLSRDIAVLRQAAEEGLASSEASIRERAERGSASGRPGEVSEALLDKARKSLSEGDVMAALSLQKAARAALGASAEEAGAHRGAVVRLFEALAAAGLLGIDASEAVARYREASPTEGGLAAATPRIAEAARDLEDRLAEYLPAIRLEVVENAAGGRWTVRVRNTGGGIALDLSAKGGAEGLVLPKMLRPGETAEGAVEAPAGPISLSYRGLMSLAPRTARASSPA